MPRKKKYRTRKLIGFYTDEEGRVRPITKGVGILRHPVTSRLKNRKIIYRSQHALAIDKALKARVTEDPKKWMRNPNRYDYEGIDTGTKTRKRTQVEVEWEPIRDTKYAWVPLRKLRREHIWVNYSNKQLEVFGNTFEVKETLKEEGFKWNKDSRRWIKKMSVEEARNEIEKLVKKLKCPIFVEGAYSTEVVHISK